MSGQAVVPLHPPGNNVDAYRASTDAASLCRGIVVQTAKNIQGRKYVCVEGWMAIAVAHGCAASARDVERVDGGVRAIGEIRRMSDGVVIAEAEGFVGEDEPTWYGGKMGSKTLPKRADYAIRAMAQTRAISRACRSAFAHVVVMIDSGLSTTPAEEVPFGGFNDDAQPGVTIEHEPRQEPPPRAKLDGAYPSTAQLKKALHEFIGAIGTATDAEAVEALKVTWKDALDQCQRDLPIWWAGDGTPEKRGIQGQIEDRVASFAAPSDESFDALMTGMLATETTLALSNYVAANEAVVETLEDGPRRMWERRLEEHEAALITLATASA